MAQTQEEARQCYPCAPQAGSAVATLPAKAPGPKRQGGKPRAAPLAFYTPDSLHLGFRLPFSKKKQKKMCSALREGSLW